MIGDHLTWPKPPCCMGEDDDRLCMCPPVERAVRGWMYGHRQPMTAEQRAFLVGEVARAEGGDRASAEAASDHDLARLVYDSWLDYAQGQR